jgi:hypothetical protein
MGYVPKDAKWYLADIIVEIIIANESRNIVHTNMKLIRADSPEEEYAKAIKYGREEEISYKNLDGNLVSFKFRGLSNLDVIHEELEDGAEISCQENIGVPEEKILSWVKPKNKLGVFASIERPKDRPNYADESIIKALEKRGFTRDELK